VRQHAWKDPQSNEMRRILARAGAPKTYTADRGVLEIWNLAPGVIMDRCAGRATAEFARGIAENIGAVIAAGHKVTVFADWELLEGYDTAARVELTEWTAKHRHEMDSVHVLLRSKIIAMGVAVGNLAAGGVTKTYVDREKWEATLLTAVGART
jgi:hypothetical protein